MEGFLIILPMIMAVMVLSSPTLVVSFGDTNTSKEDADVLLVFKSRLSRPLGAAAPVSLLPDWNTRNTSSFCRWTGVTCGGAGPGGASRRLVALDLSGLGLAGSMPAELGRLSQLSSLNLSLNSLTGGIPPQLTNCTSLALLDLSFNQLTGCIPAEIGSLSRLQILLLHKNNLGCTLPPSLANCTQLASLKIAYNEIVGTLPSELCIIRPMHNLQVLILAVLNLTGPIPSSFANCSSLVYLELAGNSLQGPIPRDLGKLARLQHLYLWGNQLTGTIPPSLAKCSALTKLELSSNSLTGRIPPSLANCSGLIGLALYSNILTGNVPAGLGNCTALQYLSLGFNHLRGYIPPELGMLPHLQVLALYHNRFKGFIPKELGNCTSLTTLALAPNNLTGPIPPELLDRLTHLAILFLDGGQLTGPLPPSLGNCSSLQLLQVLDNDLNGAIPKEIGLLLNLQKFLSENNEFSGALPKSLGNCTKLIQITLSGNQLQGSIPPELGLLKNLTFLSCSQNFITGAIPSTIANLTQLYELDLSGNALLDPFPISLATLPNLQLLDISDNHFSQDLPSEISNLSSLYLLGMSNNRWKGAIPDSFGRLQQLRNLYLQNNQLSGRIPQSLEGCFRLEDINLSFNRLQGVLPSSLSSSLVNVRLSFDLSHNNLSGPIPTWLCAKMHMVQTLDFSSNFFSGIIPESIGDCQALLTLRLANNILVGRIPQQIGQLALLVELDLSHNRLTGGLPSFLGAMASLKGLNVSYNYFTGEVPSTGVFRHINASSLQGNPGLCGSIVHKVCPLGSTVHLADTHHRKIVIIAVAASVTVVLILLLLTVAKGIHRFCIARTAQTSIPTIISQVERFSAETLALATQGFSLENIIGKGSLSVVYRGVLADGRQIAVKKLKAVPSDEEERLFVREVDILGRIRHRNLVRILGYVSNLETKALVLEWMPNGSLDGYLHRHDGAKTATSDEEMVSAWETRLRVAVGVAQALAYLHHDYDLPIIHGDVKPGNILLDADFEAHVSDFGIARLVGNPSPGGTSLSSTSFKGTFGYMAPEYAHASRISTKVDVYSYGIVILEMLTGRRPTQLPLVASTLPQWVRCSLSQQGGEYPFDETMHKLSSNSIGISQTMARLMALALACTEEHPNQRPTMREVQNSLLNMNTRGGASSRAYPSRENLCSDSPCAYPSSS